MIYVLTISESYIRLFLKAGLVFTQGLISQSSGWMKTYTGIFYCLN